MIVYKTENNINSFLDRVKGSYKKNLDHDEIKQVIKILINVNNNINSLINTLDGLEGFNYKRVVRDYNKDIREASNLIVNGDLHTYSSYIKDAKDLEKKIINGLNRIENIYINNKNNKLVSVINEGIQYIENNMIVKVLDNVKGSLEVLALNDKKVGDSTKGYIKQGIDENIEDGIFKK